MSADRRWYEGFGLALASAWPLPGLCPSSGEHADPDVVVVRESRPVTPDGLPADAALVHRDPEGPVSLYRSGRTLYWIHDRIGTLRVRDGCEVAVSPSQSARDPSLARAVLGPGIRSVLFQRGSLVLHASGVVIDGSLVAFIGPCGAGKSTAATACYAAGHAVHADDIVAVPPGSSEPLVPPGCSGLRVTRATGNASSLTTESSTAPGGKAVVDAADRFPGEPVALDAVYLLTDGERFAVDPIQSPDAAFDLLCGSFAPYADSDTTEARRHLEACAALVDRVAVRRLRRPRSLDRLDELVRSVEKDVRSR